jgi:hypothetical protein
MMSIGELSPVDFNISIHYKECLYEIGYRTTVFISKRLTSVDAVIKEVEKLVTEPKT